MPKYSNPICPKCGIRFKSKRFLAKHLCSEHSLKELEALCIIDNQLDRMSEGHIVCERCGSIIPTDKVWHFVIDKGKGIPKYCSLNCQKKASIRKNHKDGYTDRGERRYKIDSEKDFRLVSDSETNFIDFEPKMGFANKRVFEKSIITQSNMEISKKKLYIGCISNSESKIWKVGISNTVFLRWATILNLLGEDYQIVKLFETKEPTFESSKLEFEIHDHLRGLNLSFPNLPNKFGVFTENGYGKYRSCTGFTEWFSNSCEEFLISKVSELEMNDVTDSFNQYLKETKIEEVEF